MKLSKKIFALIFVFMMVFLLTACDGISFDLGNGYKIQLGGQKSSNVEIETSNSVGDDTSNTTSAETSASNSQGGNQGGNSQGGNSQGGNSKNSQNSTANPTSSEEDSKVDEQPTGTVDSALKPLTYKGLSEAITVTWNDTKIASAKVYYKLSSESSYKTVDSELVRSGGSNVGRVDIVGIKKGSYDVRVDVGSENSDIEIKGISVSAYDRSGYAHFGSSAGVGAYNNDGTLKSGVKVVYVTEETKNSAGGSGIIKALQGGNVCVRVIGKITSDTMKSASAWEKKYTELKNLNAASYDAKEGTTWGMAYIQNKSNITLEGIGEDAEIFQWGVLFKKCNSIEVRNLTFTDYPEDACALEGDSANPTSYKYFWIHNNTFNQGKRLFDNSQDQDKKEGDGAIDLKGVSNATYSYNFIQNCHKTGLVGGGDTNLQCNITYHHNYFYKDQSRLPLGRQANMHYYNNYFSSCSKVHDLRANAYIFAEGNYYESSSKLAVASGCAIKSYNDVGIGSGATKVTDRTKTVSNSCSFGSSFDTDSSKFYYDSSKKVTKVSYLTDANQAKTDCKNSAGPWKANKGV